MNDVLGGAISLFFLASVCALAWAVFLSFQKQRSRPFYLAAAGLFAISMVITSLWKPPAQKAQPQVAKVQKTTLPRAAVPTAPQRSAPVASATPSPPSQDRSDEEAKVRETWQKIMERIVAAERAMHAAQKYVANGNLIDASAAFKECQDAASGIKIDSGGLPSAIDIEINANIYKVGDGLGYGCKSLRSYLDTNAPSDAANAKSQLNGVPEALDVATHMLRAEYVKMGGNPQDIESLKSVAPDLSK